MSKIWEYHQGLWRWYNNEVFIPFKKRTKYSINDANLKSGKVYAKKVDKVIVNKEQFTAPVHVKKGEIVQKEYTKTGMMNHPQQWFEQNHWAYDNKTGNVYRIKMEDGVEVDRKLCGCVPQGTSPQQVGIRIKDRDITVRDEYSSQDRHSHVHWTIHHENRWSVEFDGKSILALCILKPKMTYAEIKNVILNEGGTIDAEGIIHRA